MTPKELLSAFAELPRMDGTPQVGDFVFWDGKFCTSVGQDASMIVLVEEHHNYGGVKGTAWFDYDKVDLRVLSLQQDGHYWNISNLAKAQMLPLELTTFLTDIVQRIRDGR